LLVELGDMFTESSWRTAHALAAKARAELAPAVTDAVATYTSVLIEFDPLATDPEGIETAIRRYLAAFGMLDDAAVFGRPRCFVVPVVYGGRDGPDLERVARDQDLTPDELVRRHAEPIYRIRCLGTPVGEPLLDGPPLPRPVPRLATPRTRVPAGSVAIAGRQATIYTAPSPGGWALIGRTPLKFARPVDPPVPYRPGDYIRFKPVSEAEASSWEGMPVAAVEVSCP
jgi:KipI family sensor histidine kinase inhibitor